MKEKFKNNPLIFINITIFLFLLIVFPLIFLIQEDKLIDKAEREISEKFVKQTQYLLRNYQYPPIYCMKCIHMIYRRIFNVNSGS